MHKPILGEIIKQVDSTGLRSEGKIFVVILVIALIFIGISIYLISIDLRVRKLENRD